MLSSMTTEDAKKEVTLLAEEVLNFCYGIIRCIYLQCKWCMLMCIASANNLL